MARAIDASRFGEIMEQWKKDCLECDDQHGADVIADVILQLDDMPTLTPPNEWVSVEERLPDKPGHYLVCTSVNYWYGGCMDKNGVGSNKGTTNGYVGTTLSVLDCFCDTTGNWNRVCNKHVTHWMNIPAPPGAVAKKNETTESNEPLTPEELRKMLGEPVWTVGISYTNDGKWAMWDIVEKADDEGVDFGYSTEGREWWNYNLRGNDGKLLNFAWACYRRPPEGEEDLKDDKNN